MDRRAAAAVLVAVACGGVRAEGLAFSGYYKSLAIASETVLPAGEPYFLDLNRVRLQVQGALTPRVAVDLQYDNEVLVGDYLRTDQFSLQSALPPQTWRRLDGRYGSGPAWYGRHRLYRGSATLAIGDTDVRVGRQRIAWGTGRLWSALDRLNPLDPTALERGERIGVDAVLIERKLGAVERLSFVHAGHRDAPPTTAVRWHANLAGVDHSLVIGRVRGERMLGGDVATQIGGAGLRVELAHHVREDGRSHRRALVGVDYAFPGSLTLSGELHYDGAGARDPSQYNFAARFAGRIQGVARRYAGGTLGYELTPLLKAVVTAVWNLDDRSRLFAPSLVWSLRENLDLGVGVQRFSGRAGSEFRAFADVGYAQVQWYF